MAQKTWVIPISSVSTPENGSGDSLRSGSGSRSPNASRRRESARTLTRPVDPGRTLFFSYVLGPFGLLVSPSGRRSRVWFLLGALAVAAAVVSIRRNPELVPALERGSGYGALWLAVTVAAVLSLAATWARAVHLAGCDAARSLARMPQWAASAWLAGFLGVVLPGLGLHLAGHSRRAAGAILVLGASAAGIFALLHADLIWNWNHISRYGTLSDTMLEALLIGAAGSAVLGGVVWITQALDGMRLAQRKSATEVADHGDRFGLALLAVSVLMVALFRPALWAVELDSRAEHAQSLGQKLIPVALAEAAHRLDPSRPDYALRAAALHTVLGNRERARSLTERVESNWRAYQAASPLDFSPAAESMPQPFPDRPPDLRVILSGPVPAARPDSL